MCLSHVSLIVFACVYVCVSVYLCLFVVVQYGTNLEATALVCVYACVSKDQIWCQTIGHITNGHLFVCVSVCIYDGSK